MKVRMRSGARALLGTLALVAGCNSVLNNPPGNAAPTDEGGVPADSGGTVPLGEDASNVEDAPFDSSVAVAMDAGFEADSSRPDSAPPTIPACALGDKLCNGACVSVADPLFGCGPSVCSACALEHATAACSASGCAIGICESGYADCDQNPANGCETDLSEPAHCGSCNAACTSLAPDCNPSGTGFACATGCGGAAPTLCGSQCVDLMTSLDDCGACSNTCPTAANGSATCAGGKCGITCNANFHACGGTCAANVSPSTCGAQCTACPVGAHAVATCNDVQCGLECQAGFADCDGNATDGCEVDVATSATDCGACGHSCEGGACSHGTCSPPPVVDSGPAPVDSSVPPVVDAGAPSNDAESDSTTPPTDAETGD